MIPAKMDYILILKVNGKGSSAVRMCGYVFTSI